MSKIRDYFSNKTLFITGATGFLGKALLEKILRTLPDVRKVYLLIRPRGRASRLRSAQQRFRNEILRSSIFNRLRSQMGGEFEDFVLRKVEVVEGDLIHDRLGLSDADFDRLTNEIEVHVHSAAPAEFDERLDLGLELNALGPRRTIAFARQCRRLEALIHISTCYVNGATKGWAYEEVAELPFDAEEEIARLRRICDEIKQETGEGSPECVARLVEAGLEEARRRGWHDTYTFTKSLGEQLIVRERGNVPTVILRPSIIESTLSEPEGGWIDGFRVADPLFIGFGQGMLKDFPGRPDTICDMIPCDFVVNAILAAAPRIATEGGLQVYQVATGDENPIRVRDLYRITTDYFNRFPMYDRRGAPIPPPRWSWPNVATHRRKLAWLYRTPLDVLAACLKPLSFVPLVEQWRQFLATRRKSIDRLLYYVDIYGPYARIEARFSTSNTAELWAWLSKEDQQEFDFNVKRIDWRTYLAKVHLPGLKRNLLNIRDETPVPKVSRDHAYWLRTNAAEQAVRAVTRKVMKIIAERWFRLEVRGTENLPQGAFIIAANHCSHIDTGVVITAFGTRREELFILGARDYFFDNKAKGWFFHTFLNVVPFDRTGSPLEGMRLARSILRAKHPVLIFPEGTRSVNGRLQSFRAGIGWLALELGVPIVPCYIDGTFQALPKGRAWPRRTKTRVTFGPPVTMDRYRKVNGCADRRELYRRVAEDVRQVVEQLKQGRLVPALPEPPMPDHATVLATPAASEQVVASTR